MSDSKEEQISVSSPPVTRRVEGITRVFGVILLLVVGTCLGGWIVHSQRQQEAMRVLLAQQVTSADIFPVSDDYHQVRVMKINMRDTRGIALLSDESINAVGDCDVYHQTSAGQLELLYKLPMPPTCITGWRDQLWIGLRDHIETYSEAGKRLACWPAPGKRSYFTSLATDGVSLWAADAGERAVYRYNRQGQITARATGFVVPSPYLTVALAPDGMLWVTNPGKHRVEQYSPYLKKIREWGKASNLADGFSGCCNPTAVAVLKKGGFVTTEKGRPYVKKFNTDGTLDCIVAGPQQFDTGAVLTGVFADNFGRILVFDKKHNIIRVFNRKDGVPR